MSSAQGVRNNPTTRRSLWSVTFWLIFIVFVIGAGVYGRSIFRFLQHNAQFPISEEFGYSCMLVLLFVLLIVAKKLVSTHVSMNNSQGLEFWQTVSMDIVGAIITGTLVIFVVGSATDVAHDTADRESLLAAMRSSINSTAINAVDVLRNKKWLEDGTVSEGNFYAANLYQAKLMKANLSHAYLDSAILNGANLSGACLRDAILSNAQLQGADLSGADMRGAKLDGANLEGIILPNSGDPQAYGLPNTWTAGNDMDIYSNVNNPNFYRVPNSTCPP